MLLVQMKLHDIQACMYDRIDLIILLQMIMQALAQCGHQCLACGQFSVKSWQLVAFCGDPAAMGVSEFDIEDTKFTLKGSHRNRRHPKAV